MCAAFTGGFLAHDTAIPDGHGTGLAAERVLEALERDIAERKRVEASLRDSQERLSLAIEAAGLGLWTWDTLTDRVTWSTQCYAIHGMREGDFDLTGASFFALVHPEDRERVQATVTRALQARERYIAEFRIVRPDGSIAWVANHGRARFDDDGRPVSMLGTITDVTSLKQAGFALQAALTASRTGTFRWDIRNNALAWDDELDRLFGLPPGEIVRSLPQFIERVHPDDRAGVIAACERCRDEGADFEMEFRVVWPDGSVRWLYDRGLTYRDSSGQPAWMTGACVDITQHKATELALRTSENRFRAAVEAASDILWTNDPSGRMTGPQPGWGAFTGLSQADYQGYGWSTALHPDDAQPAIDAWKHAVATGTKYACEQRVRRHDGEWRTFSVRALPVRGADGAVQEWVGVHTDITELREAQRTIERQNRELRELDARKDVFIATLSHELRNPLSPVLAATEVLGRPGLTGEQLGWARQVIQRQVRQMAVLLDDLLDVSRITQGKLRLRREHAPFAPMLDSAVETVQPLVQRKRHRLSVSCPRPSPVLDADPLRVAQVVSNLLANAAKYTPPGGQIDVAATVQGDWLQVTVRDTGIGIPPQSLQTLFTMFAQAEAGLEHSEGGLGIGLALVKGLVELHGGRVEAASDGVDRGSVFTVHLPLAAVRDRDVAGAPQPALAAGARRVLVIDDNIDAADSLSALLELSGHEVRVAYDGTRAVETAREFSPDVMVLDIGMPGMDGYEVARALRAAAGLRQPLLVALTGWGQERDRARAQAAGFDHHLTKPVDPADLERLLAAR